MYAYFGYFLALKVKTDAATASLLEKMRHRAQAPLPSPSPTSSAEIANSIGLPAVEPAFTEKELEQLRRVRARERRGRSKEKGGRRKGSVAGRCSVGLGWVGLRARNKIL